MEPDGILRNEREFDGTRWNFLEPDGILWNQREFDGIEWWNLMEVY